MELYYEAIEKSDSEETIVFLHEGLGCVQMWKDYPKSICDTLSKNGIVYDRAGYGKSPGDLTLRTANYLHEAATELNNLISFLNLDKVILYGHSDGGSIALIYASRYPDKVSAVITEAAHVFNEPKTIAGVREARPFLEQGKMEGLKKYHGNNYKDVFYAWNNIWLSDSFKNWNITEDLKHLKCNLLVIQGEDDQYGTLEQVKTIERLSGGETLSLVLPNCGHAPHKEQRVFVIEAVNNFLA